MDAMKPLIDQLTKMVQEGYDFGKGKVHWSSYFFRGRLLSDRWNIFKPRKHSESHHRPEIIYSGLFEKGPAMTFSDENLKWLKKNIEDSDRKLNKFGYFLDLEEFEALLHRLECAEKALTVYRDNFGGSIVEGVVKAWRTSAGKDPAND